MNGWQPIETLKSDDTVLLAHVFQGEFLWIASGIYEPSDEKPLWIDFTDNEHNILGFNNVTHWMALPEIPS